MKHVKLTLATAVTFALMGATAHADSWDLTQTATLGADTTLTQTDSSNGSVQALNAINMGATSTINSGSSQTSAMGANGLILNQDGTTENSTQAANYAVAATIGDAIDTFEQLHTDTGSVTLNQSGTGSGGNTQALNHAAATNLVDLTQTANTASSIDLTQNTGTDNNIQAVNNAEGAVLGGIVTQDVIPSGSLSLDQQGAGSNTQAANRMEATGSTIDDVTQTVESPTVQFSQTTSGTGLQAGNMVSAADVTFLDQSLSGDDINMTQNKAGAGSIQAGNYLITTGVVADVSQIMGDSNDDAVYLEQTSSGKGTIQAGNLLDASDVGADVNAIQGILTGSATLTMNQDSTTLALQAGNALLTGGDGFAAQEVDVAQLVMTQTSANNSIQAANYAGVKN